MTAPRRRRTRLDTGAPPTKLNLVRLRHALRRGEPEVSWSDDGRRHRVNTAEMAERYRDDLDRLDREMRDRRAALDRELRARSR